MKMRNIAIASLLGTIGVTISATADDGHVFRYPIFYGSSEIGSGNENIVIVTPPYNITFNVDKTNTEGKADSGDVVYVYDEGGGLIGGGTVDSSGNFSISISPALTGGDKVIYIAENNGGIKSKEVIVTIPDYTNVDLTEPDDITFDESGDSVSGIADPNVTIIIEDDAGNTIGTGVTDNNGDFNVSVTPPVTGGDNITLRSENGSGDESNNVSVTVPENVGELTCDPSALVEGEMYDNVCGLETLNLTRPVYYGGTYAGKMYFLSQDIGRYPKEVGAVYESSNGYNNTVDLYKEHGNQANYNYNYAAKKCYQLDGRVGWFLPSHTELKYTIFGGGNSQEPWASKLGIQQSSNARLVISDEATPYAQGYLVANNNGALKNSSFQGQRGETLCAITPSSIQSEK